jgi:hypothetical protein
MRLAFQHFVGITEGQAVLSGQEHVFDPAQHLTKEVIRGIGNDHANGACALGSEAACDGVWAVAQLTDGIENTTARLFFDKTCIVENVRDCGPRNIRQARDIGNGWSSEHEWRLLGVKVRKRIAQPVSPSIAGIFGLVNGFFAESSPPMGSHHDYSFKEAHG